MRIVFNPLKAGLNSNTSEQFELLVRVQTEPEDCQGRDETGLNLALVLDRSGSMHKCMHEAKACVVRLFEGLDEKDKVTLVAYDDDFETVVPLLPAAEAKQMIRTALATIGPRGCTNLHGGWLCGAELLAGAVKEDAVSRIILLSDGMANRGLTKSDEICAQVRGLADAGVTTSTVGLGLHFNEELMVAMAEAGKGGSHYGERAEDIEETFDAELGMLKALAFKDIQLSIINPRSREFKVANEYSVRNGQYQLPSISCGSEAWILLKMSMENAIALASSDEEFEICISALDQHGNPVTIKEKYKFPSVVTDTDYKALTKDTLTTNRSIELHAAEIQMAARLQAKRGNWQGVNTALRKLEELGEGNEWIKSSIAFLKRQAIERNTESFSKESYHKSRAYRNRISSVNESNFFDIGEEANESAFLRRKMNQGRKTNRDNQ